MTLTGIIIWLVIGAVVGWLASIIMRTPGQGLLFDILIGIVGAALGGFIFGRGDINNSGLTVTSFLVSLLGAVILLAIVNLARRGFAR